MKKTILLLSIAFLMPPLMLRADQDTCPHACPDNVVTPQEFKKRLKALAIKKVQDDDDRVTEVVLANWLCMVGNVIQIGRDPHNSQNVGNQVSQMIHGIANVVKEVTRRYNISPEELLEIITEKAHMPS